MKHKTKLLALLLAVVTVLSSVALASCEPMESLSPNTGESEITSCDTIHTEPDRKAHV